MLMDTPPTPPRPIYLDGHATTPLAPEAAAAMAPWWRELAANAHSPHAAGQRAAAAVNHARGLVARLVGVGPSEVVFTSGATEANALALLGGARAARRAGDPRRRIIVSAIEHKSVLGCAARLETEDFEVVRAPVTPDGVLDLGVLARLATPETLLISVMAANNETGVVQPIDAVAAVARAAGAALHVDASQQAGKLPLDLGLADFASLSAHKMYGPLGVGALIVSSAAAFRPEPLFAGGDQENGLRPGTLPVPLIVGFGEAARVAIARLAADADHGRRLAGRLIKTLENRQVRFIINGLKHDRLPGSLSLRLKGCDAASLIARISPFVSAAEGSACTSGQIAPSHVLTAMGLSHEEASSTLRLMCGRDATAEEIDRVAEVLIEAIEDEIGSRWTTSPVGSGHERPAPRFRTPPSVRRP
jgi:cysteine desulfurase|nr:cysteine desulfurase family protein [Brevundimonas diminuta]